MALGGDAGGPAEPDPRRPRAGRLAGLALLLAPFVVVTLTGCASGGLREMVGMAPAATTNPADAKADTKADAAGKSAAAAAPSAAPAVAPVAVSPAAQRAFDDARRLLQAGRVDEAERAFRALVKSNPELGGPHANLGLIHRQRGQTAEAVAELEKAAQLGANNGAQQALVLNQLGVAYRENGQFDKARDAYERAIAIDGQYAAPVLNLGILSDLYLRDTSRALSMYERYQSMTGGKDTTVAKWVADLKNRKPAAAAPSATPSPATPGAASKKEAS